MCGAGRQMSRTKARKAIHKGSSRNIWRASCDTNRKVKDEAPQVYKDLKSVMTNQDSHVEVVHKLQVLVNVKDF